MTDPVLPQTTAGGPCASCGHDPACGMAGVIEASGEAAYYCHDDACEHGPISCYEMHQWAMPLQIEAIFALDEEDGGAAGAPSATQEPVGHGWPARFRLWGHRKAQR